jgi:large subunit ribosomal protein L29
MPAKPMRAEAIRELTTEEIHAHLVELEEEQFRLRMRSASETLEDPLRFRVIRREIARMKTILRERQAAQAAAPAAR